jgi:glycosyltransferase involved in cell wall biosynthesis
MSAPSRPERSLRVLGLASSEAEYRTGLTGVGGAMGHLFGEIARNATLVDVFQPLPPLHVRAQSRLLTLSTSGDRARRSYKRHAPLFLAKSRRCRQEVQRRRGSIDVVLQWEFFFAPTDRFPSVVPYCVYNDWTTALIEREYPQWLLPRVRQGTNRVQRALLQNAAYVFTFTELVRRSVISDYGVDPERVVTVGAGANLERLPSDARPDRAAEPVVLLVGNDYWNKGVDVLVRAMPLVRERVPACRAVVVGGSGGRSLRPSPGVEVHARVPKPELARLYGRATLFALPSRAEAFGHVLAEAMAYRLPCVASDTGGIPEVVDDGRTGYLVPVGDHRALADRIVELLTDPDRMRRMGEAGRRKVEARFTWDRVVSRMLPYLQRAAGLWPAES